MDSWIRNLKVGDKVRVVGSIIVGYDPKNYNGIDLSKIDTWEVARRYRSNNNVLKFHIKSPEFIGKLTAWENGILPGLPYKIEPYDTSSCEVEAQYFSYCPVCGSSNIRTIDKEPNLYCGHCGRNFTITEYKEV